MNLWKLSSESEAIPGREEWRIPESVDEGDLDKPFYEYRTIYSQISWPEWNLMKTGYPNWEADIRIQWWLRRGGFAQFYWSPGRVDLIEVRSGDGRKISPDEALGLSRFLKNPFWPGWNRFNWQMQKPLTYSEEQRRDSHLDHKMDALNYYDPEELQEAVAQALYIEGETEQFVVEDEVYGEGVEWPDEVNQIVKKITSVIALVMHEGRYGWWNSHDDLIKKVASEIRRNPSIIRIFVTLYDRGDGGKAAEFLKRIEPKTPLVLLTDDEEEEDDEPESKHASRMRIWSLGDV